MDAMVAVDTMGATVAVGAQVVGAGSAGAVGVVGGPALSGVPGQLSVLCSARGRELLNYF